MYFLKTRMGNWLMWGTERKVLDIEHKALYTLSTELHPLPQVIG
jgi:hypothetical protein